MASTNTLPVPKLTYLGWQSGHGFLKHRSSFGSVPHVLILHPRDLGLVPFFPIFGQFHVLDPSSALPSSVPLVHLLFLNPFSLRLALLLSIKLHVSCLHSSLASRVPRLPFQTRVCSLSNPHLFPFKPTHVPFRFSSAPPGSKPELPLSTPPISKNVPSNRPIKSSLSDPILPTTQHVRRWCGSRRSARSSWACTSRSRACRPSWKPQTPSESQLHAKTRKKKTHVRRN